jgi:hypothetical protein
MPSLKDAYLHAWRTSGFATKLALIAAPVFIAGVIFIVGLVLVTLWLKEPLFFRTLMTIVGVLLTVFFGLAGVFKIFETRDQLMQSGPKTYKKFQQNARR